MSEKNDQGRQDATDNLTPREHFYAGVGAGCGMGLMAGSMVTAAACVLGSQLIEMALEQTSQKDETSQQIEQKSEPATKDMASIIKDCAKVTGIDGEKEGSSVKEVVDLRNQMLQCVQNQLGGLVDLRVARDPITLNSTYMYIWSGEDGQHFAGLNDPDNYFFDDKRSTSSTEIEPSRRIDLLKIDDHRRERNTIDRQAMDQQSPACQKEMAEEERREEKECKHDDGDAYTDCLIKESAAYQTCKKSYDEARTQGIRHYMYPEGVPSGVDCGTYSMHNFKTRDSEFGLACWTTSPLAQ